MFLRKRFSRGTLKQSDFKAAILFYDLSTNFKILHYFMHLFDLRRKNVDTSISLLRIESRAVMCKSNLPDDNNKLFISLITIEINLRSPATKNVCHFSYTVSVESA